MLPLPRGTRDAVADEGFEAVGEFGFVGHGDAVIDGLAEREVALVDNHGHEPDEPGQLKLGELGVLEGQVDAEADFTVFGVHLVETDLRLPVELIDRALDGGELACAGFGRELVRAGSLDAE